MNNSREALNRHLQDARVLLKESLHASVEARREILREVQDIVRIVREGDQGE